MYSRVYLILSTNFLSSPSPTFIHLRLLNNPNKPPEFLRRKFPVVNLKLLAIEYDLLFKPAPLEIRHFIKVFLHLLDNRNFRRACTVLSMFFPQIADNAVNILVHKMAEVLIVIDMCGFKNTECRIVLVRIMFTISFAPLWKWATTRAVCRTLST